MVDSGLVNEQHFLLFVQHVELAETLQAALSSTDGPAELPMNLEMTTDRVGRLCVDVPIGDISTSTTCFGVSLHDMPTQIETFKSHNHINLMKSADIGQVLVVHPYPFALEEADQDMSIPGLLSMEQEGKLPAELRRGLTPPMLKGAQMFKYKPDAEPALVEVVESQLLALLHGEAPDGWTIEDVAEVWVPNDSGRGGKWMPLATAPQSVLQGAKGK